tara:strand:- start:5579 stop:6052 length:474 start_codon:yes stop_codon:yes gene_type:complete
MLLECEADGRLEGEKTMANIFQDETNEDVITTIKQTMSVGLNDEGEAIVSFATNRGKGSGAQSMRASDFPEYVDTLEGFVSDGIEELPEEDLSPAETVRSTIRQSDGMISFRVRSGKGAKPAKIPAGDFAEVVELLRSTVGPVTAAASNLQPSAEEE